MPTSKRHDLPEPFGTIYVGCFIVISEIGDELVEQAESIRKSSTLGPLGIDDARKTLQAMQRRVERSLLAMDELEKRSREMAKETKE